MSGYEEFDRNNGGVGGSSPAADVELELDEAWLNEKARAEAFYEIRRALRNILLSEPQSDAQARAMIAAWKVYNGTKEL